MSRIITLDEYAAGRDKLYPKEWETVRDDAIKFLEKLNGYLGEAFPDKSFYLNSGWRPVQINNLIHGAEHSYHTKGRAADIKDRDGWLHSNLVPHLKPEQADLLRDWGLFMEDPASTKTWIHLDDGDRVDRPDRIFIP